MNKSKSCLEFTDGHDQEVFESRAIVLVLGDSQVGKTALLKHFTSNQYSSSIKIPFISDIKRNQGLQQYIYKKQFNQYGPATPHSNDQRLIEFWEIKGGVSKNYSEVYLHKMVGRIQGIIYVFDGQNLKSLKNIFAWMAMIRDMYTTQQDKDWLFSLPLLMIANKLNLVKDPQELQKIKDNINLFCIQRFKCNPGDNLIVPSSLKALSLLEWHRITQKDKMNRLFIDTFLDYCSIQALAKREKGAEQREKGAEQREKENESPVRCRRRSLECCSTHSLECCSTHSVECCSTHLSMYRLDLDNLSNLYHLGMLKQEHIAKYLNDNQSWIKDKVTTCLHRLSLKCLADLLCRVPPHEKQD